jgi:ATP-dependent exoDNAse (exonuclease V) beta subunit
LKILRENGFDIDPDELATLPVYDLSEALTRIFTMNDPANVYLQFFLDKVLLFTRRNSSTPVDFLEWWEKKGGSLSVIVPEGLDAVSIMTIHKAKGLQFPVVILPAFPEGNRPSKKYLWIDLPAHHSSGLPAAMVESDKTLEQTAFSEKYVTETGKSFMDDLNVLYVALTRPEERLYILSPWPSAPKETPSSVTGFLQSWLIKTGEWTDEKALFEWGRYERYEGKRDKPAHQSLQLSRFISTPWKEKISIRRRAPEIWNVSDPKRSSDWGSLVHTLMSQVICANDMESVIGEALSSGMISGSQKETLDQKLQKILGDPQINRFFQPGLRVKTEAEIMLPDGSFYRPDRIIIDGTNAVVIDYKTGKQDPVHARQVDRYAELLAEMKYTNIRKYLLYLEPDVNLVEV